MFVRRQKKTEQHHDERRRAKLHAAASNDGLWWHSIDLGDGVTTRGEKTTEVLAGELAALRLPDLRGKTVLDIGAWDGYFAFAAERMGAARVVALDHYIWSIDLPKLLRYRERCTQEGVAPRPYSEVPEVWYPDTLPGKRGFDAAHNAMGSSVEAIVGDFMNMNLDELGVFDVVLFLGVLYHLENPFAALQRLARVTRELALIETEAIVVPGFETQAMCEFFEGAELQGDVTNWWAPNVKALTGMCRAAGFRDVTTLVDENAESSAVHDGCPSGQASLNETNDASSVDSSGFEAPLADSPRIRRCRRVVQARK